MSVGAEAVDAPEMIVWLEVVGAEMVSPAGGLLIVSDGAVGAAVDFTMSDEVASDSSDVTLGVAVVVAAACAAGAALGVAAGVWPTVEPPVLAVIAVRGAVAAGVAVLVAGARRLVAGVAVAAAFTVEVGADRME